MHVNSPDKKGLQGMIMPLKIKLTIKSNTWAFKHILSPKRQIFGKSNLQKFKCPGVGEITKLQINLHIICPCNNTPESNIKVKRMRI